MSFDVAKIRADFPILSRQVNGKPLVYLDNGASAQKPQVVIDAVTRGYAEEYANVHRGLHFLSNLSGIFLNPPAPSPPAPLGTPLKTSQPLR